MPGCISWTSDFGNSRHDFYPLRMDSVRTKEEKERERRLKRKAKQKQKKYAFPIIGSFLGRRTSIMSVNRRLISLLS